VLLLLLLLLLLMMMMRLRLLTLTLLSSLMQPVRRSRELIAALGGSSGGISARWTC
jgi:hypothetical protein